MIGLLVGTFVLTAVVGRENQLKLLGWLGLTPRALASGHLWKLVTTVFVAGRPIMFVFDLLMLWMFVPVLEGFWGTRRFLKFVAATTLVGNTVAALVGLALDPDLFIVGIGPFIYGAIAAYGVVFANQQVQFFGVIPIRGKVLAIGFVCYLAVFTLLERAWVDASGFFAAMALAWLMTTGVWTPNVWWLKYRRWRLRRKYTVIDGGADPKKRWMN